ncbi:type I methionyl aminopeptidase [Candidatus Pantoea edessiphila]|uniref:Methionine aminopeptidase n=1 Tax=Candidatus Pantoea edessiphila TaxID=2044610 RepID=A0A2P5SY48_9GAMM|nr:type I methionyl aminopeptidase [Candidatus Pantoea edessiphila]MBK4775570.1 type I methionyl aminopeptidase [Pantoea sp. Edef]PPI87223.1 type I methionyl aminopeptidase [Candidatus Pantoea edessiphila]
MSIFLKNNEEIKKIRIACHLAADVLEMIEQYVIPGITTGKIDHICHEYMIYKQNVIPACLGYKGFPKSVCISVNEVVCHGIPNDDQILKNGDIVNIDVTVIKDSYHGDTSKMFIVGKPTVEGKNLCKITQESLYLALNVVKPGINVNRIGYIIQKHVECHGLSVVRDYCGHGIGKNFHEEPQILHYTTRNNKIVLKKGMIFTIEPMVNIGNHHVYTMIDGWTVKTKDQSLSAQYEHTILVTNNGCEILTLRKEEDLPPLLINN